MNYRVFRFILALLLPVMAGCTGMDTVRLGQDKPADLDNLLGQHEYVRARQLTSKYASLDSPEVQTRINSEEAAYEKKITSQALELESENDLLGAVQLLSDALQKIPHSTTLRELRNTLEPERAKQLQDNEREQLIARARFILGQQQLYREQANLAPPSMAQRWEDKRNRKEAMALSGQLMGLGRKAMASENRELAKTCLQLSQSLHETTEVATLLSNIYAAEEANKQVAREETRQANKKAKIKHARKRKKQQQDQKNKTEVLLAETRQALVDNNLQLARAALAQIPATADTNSEVQSLQDDLGLAIDARVKKLMAAGDAQYRADNVLLAVRTWTQALSLAPDNQYLRDRVERANKVLARLEELKRQQHRQPSVLNLPVQPTRVGVTRTSSQR